MTADEFLADVAEHTGGDRERAERYVHAVLRTLSERITRGEADDIAAQLPSELQADLLSEPPEAERFDAAEFLRRVGERAQASSRVEAEAATRAVFATLRRAVTRGEIDDVVPPLPEDLDDFFRIPEGGRRRV